MRLALILLRSIFIVLVSIAVGRILSPRETRISTDNVKLGSSVFSFFVRCLQLIVLRAGSFRPRGDGNKRSVRAMDISYRREKNRPLAVAKLLFMAASYSGDFARGVLSSRCFRAGRSFIHRCQTAARNIQRN